MLCDFLLKDRHDVLGKGTEVCKPLMGCFMFIWLKVTLHLLFAVRLSNFLWGPCFGLPCCPWVFK